MDLMRKSLAGAAVCSNYRARYRTAKADEGIVPMSGLTKAAGCQVKAGQWWDCTGSNAMSVLCWGAAQITSTPVPGSPHWGICKYLRRGLLPEQSKKSLAQHLAQSRSLA